MNCSEYKELISAHADGELAGPAKAELQAHIGHCVSCKRLFDETVTLQRDVANLLADCAEVPDLVSAVMGRIRPRPRARFAWVWAAAAVVALVSIVGYLLTQSPPQHRTSPVVATDRTNHKQVAEFVPRKTPRQPVLGVATGDLLKRPATATVDRVAHRPMRKRMPVTVASAKGKKGEGAAPSPSVVDEAEVAVEYVDSMPVAQDPNAPPPPPLAAIASGRRVEPYTETIIVNGKPVERLCYRIIRDESPNTEPQGGGNEKNQ